MLNPFSIQYAGVHLNMSCLSCTNLAARMLAHPDSSKQPVQTNQSRYKLLVLQIDKASWKCLKGTIHNQIFVRNIAIILMYTLQHYLHLAKDTWPLYGIQSCTLPTLSYYCYTTTRLCPWSNIATNSKFLWIRFLWRNEAGGCSSFYSLLRFYCSEC